MILWTNANDLIPLALPMYLKFWRNTWRSQYQDKWEIWTFSSETKRGGSPPINPFQTPHRKEICERCCHSDIGGTNLSVKTWRMCETMTSSERPHPPQQQMKRHVTTASEWFLSRSSYQRRHAWLMGWCLLTFVLRWLRPILLEKEKDKEGSLMETLSQTPSGESPCPWWRLWVLTLKGDGEDPTLSTLLSTSKNPYFLYRCLEM